MEQSELNAAQTINETCYGLIKQGYSLRDISKVVGKLRHDMDD